jgi:hypothetical protein
MAIFRGIATLIARIMRGFAGRYRPERHYMRGVGPASKRSQRAGLIVRKRLRKTGALPSIDPP